MKTKLVIEEISDSIGAEIKKNCSSLGIDTAEYNTGICLLRTDSKYIYIEGLYKIKLQKNTKDTLHQKIDKFMGQALALKKQISQRLQEIKVDPKQPRIVVIEECWLGPSPQTFKILAKFACLIYLVFRDWGTYIPDPIQPKSARARIKFKQDKDSKETVKKQVHHYLEDEFGVVIDDEDCADGFVLALSGLVQIEK